jgi:hypothetical protein
MLAFFAILLLALGRTLWYRGRFTNDGSSIALVVTLPILRREKQLSQLARHSPSLTNRTGAQASPVGTKLCGLFLFEAFQNRLRKIFERLRTTIV